MATDASSSFTQFVPGFDFLQGLVKNAGAAIPGMGQWVAPTLDPAELDKRIDELRTVQFWLEQNARMLGATIQALEVQRMTLSTLQTMNVQMGDLRDSLRVRMPESPVSGPSAPQPKSEASAPQPEGEPTAPPPGVVDPMQWWGALTRQFTDLAANAIKEPAAGAARKMADTLVKQTVDATGQALRAAAAMPAATVRKATGSPPPAPRKRPAARKRAP